MNMNDTFDKIKEVLQHCQNIAIGGHQNPDGDAVGACFALAYALRKQGKTVSVVLEEYSKKYDMISEKELILSKSCYHTAEFDAFVALDSGDKQRLGDAEILFDKSKYKINIDHHVSNTYFGEYNYVNGDASSTSEIVYQFLRYDSVLDKQIASALYAGILYDTAGFRHSSTSPATMSAAAELMTYSIPANKIYTTFFDNRTFSELKLLGRAFEKAQKYFNENVIYTFLTQNDIEECHGTNKEIDSVVNFIKGVENIKIACFIYQKGENEVKASFRGEDGFDVCKLAQHFGGGGHVKAAGCTIYSTIEQAWHDIQCEIVKLF